MTQHNTQVHPAKIEYYEGSLNPGADGVSRIEQDDDQLKKWKFGFMQFKEVHKRMMIIFH